MNVVIDVNPLANAAASASAQCGIYRVVSETMKCFDTTNDKLHFIAPQSLEVEINALEVAERIHPDSGVQFISMYLKSPTRRALAKQIKHIHRWSQRFRRFNPIRLVCGMMWRAFALSSPRRDLDDHFDVYISTYPEFDPTIRARVRIIFIYDAIPAIHPEYFTDSNVAGWWKAMRSVQRLRDIIVCNSESTKRDLVRILQFPAESIRVIPLGVDASFMPSNDAERTAQARKKYRIPDSPWVLALSAIEPRKNLESTLAAVQRAAQTIPNLQLVIAGPNGWKMGQFIQNATNNLAHFVHFTGYIDERDLASIYASADAFIFMSHYEGFGLPPLEAMACGCPVICSNSSSLPEVVGNAAMRRDPTDIDGIAASIVEILHNKPLRMQMSRDSIQRAKQFSWMKFRASLHLLCTNLVNTTINHPHG